MIRRLDTADLTALSAFATIIDVRSPAEFAEDHVPRAINLPVLDNEERARIGAMYVQQSRFEARRAGAALVARNIATHLEGGLREQPADFAPLIYCWRGGQRSGAMATVLDQVGWRPTLLDGGYRTYRQTINRELTVGDPIWKVVLLGGHTGTAKTEILRMVGHRGVQVLDLEEIAAHRGSLLGDLIHNPQPSQKMFESCLLGELAKLDSDRPVLLEAESSKIGNLYLPARVWMAMRGAPVIEVTASLVERGRYLVSAYADLIEDTERLDAALTRLPGRHGRKLLEIWRNMVSDRSFEALAISLTETHYDPAYDRWARTHPRPLIESIHLDKLDPLTLTRTAERVAALVNRYSS